MRSTAKDRLGASVQALGVTWLIAGIMFCLVVRGPGVGSLWLIWGSGVFLVGWVFIAVPLIAIGDRIMRIPALALALAGGCSGALLMLSPNLLARILDPEVHYARFSFRDLAWPAVAFAVAFAATALYRVFLCRCMRGSDRVEVQ